MDLRSIFDPILGVDKVLDSTADKARYGKDWLSDFTANPGLVLLPTSIEQVQAIVRACNAHKIALVPSGGRTGLSGGATALNGEVLLSFERLNKILAIDAVDRTVTCEAGTITQKVQEHAEAHGLYFPVDFASKGSSQIGGNIATNAGGVRVIRYGNIRDWVLGLKVVTADGVLLDLNGSLYKNQSGYDLKSLIIGSEGTLGIIVEATLRLTNPPGELVRILCAIDESAGALKLLQEVRAQFRNVSMFEYFAANALQMVLKHHGLANPFNTIHPHYLLIEVEQGTPSLRDELDAKFYEFIERGLLKDVVVSHSVKQAQDLLSLRELIPETLTRLHTLHKNDISVPIPAIPAFIAELDKTIHARYPDFEVVIFGHIGDGNLHVNVTKPAALSKEEFFAFCKEADRHLFAIVQKFKGSISAEHGVGLLKKEFLSFSRSKEEIVLMKSLKRAFDPHNILNPGKIFDL